ncbi:hypothetical protein D8B26_002394 [Coccidioides posadasii str. Silveira]|uniref:uncharacterized protein n=1 Tax=Coccidioides posadasii (strain RMSCC 757 / Silveira) TaxID=443226 RepID=UPI001BF0CD05|nr:hypothetical protein D8B26_002394 [Coccidioides posadasii str. Silveira]
MTKHCVYIMLIHTEREREQKETDKRGRAELASGREQVGDMERPAVGRKKKKKETTEPEERQMALSALRPIRMPGRRTNPLLRIINGPCPVVPRPGDNGPRMYGVWSMEYVWMVLFTQTE